MVSLLAATAAVLVGGPLGITPRPSVTPTVISPSKRMAQMRRIVKGPIDDIAFGVPRSQ